MPKKVYLLVSIVCVCLVFLYPSSDNWSFQKTSIGTCKFGGQQSGVRLYLWKNPNSKGSGLKITAPSKFKSLFSTEISWAGIETLKPTCQSFDIMAYTDQVQSGIGEGKIWLQISGNSLVQCGPNYSDSNATIAAILRQDNNLQLFGPLGNRLAKWTISKKDQRHIESYWKCLW